MARNIPPIFLLLALATSSLFIGCAGTPSKQAEPLYETLEKEQCPEGDFRGWGTAESERAAIDQAIAGIAAGLQDTVFVQSKLTTEVIDEKDRTHYFSQINRNSSITNASDIKIKFKKQQGKETGVVACLSRSDAAKGFAERLRPLADSLEFAAKGVLDAKHPKLKSEAWQKARLLWGSFMVLRSTVQNLDKEKAASFEPVSALYAKARDGYLDFCQTAKLYWNPEQNDVYSEIAFSKLSKNLKLEKASCNGHGISLIYKNTGHKCEYAGMFECTCKPSLLIASCYGEEYRLLESKNVKTYQKTEEVAIQKLREKLEYETFWNDWEQEIKQWRPICE
ncbi:MAG: hypothetical protein FWF67_03970 [Fibromonadales bacterium]|nr:hypothetical protein [Fibromonadales bacterium]